MKAKIYILTFIMISFIVSYLYITNKPEPKPRCALCSKEATHTVSGPAENMKNMDIDISKLTVSGGVYSIKLCDTCFDKLEVAVVTKNPFLEENDFYD